jgi:hypothetical protein
VDAVASIDAARDWVLVGGGGTLLRLVSNPESDPAVAADHAAQGRPYSDAAPFLEAWAARPELASVTALGPHVYGPSMAWSLADNTGAQAWKTLTATFGSGSAWARAVASC